MKSNGKIYLIGMPGAGKSTFGLELSKAMKFPFIDLDVEIESNEGQAISKIFEKHGEDYFREVEANMLKKLSEDHDTFIMSTGGGTPCYYNGLDFMRQFGVVLYLKASLKTLSERLKKTNIPSRPKFDREQGIHTQLEQLYASRVGIYERADVILGEDSNCDEVIQKIKDIV